MVAVTGVSGKFTFDAGDPTNPSGWDGTISIGAKGDVFGMDYNDSVPLFNVENGQFYINTFGLGEILNSGNNGPTWEANFNNIYDTWGQNISQLTFGSNTSFHVSTYDSDLYPYGPSGSQLYQAMDQGVDTYDEYLIYTECDTGTCAVTGDDIEAHYDTVSDFCVDYPELCTDIGWTTGY